MNRQRAGIFVAALAAGLLVLGAGQQANAQLDDYAYGYASQEVTNITLNTTATIGSAPGEPGVIGAETSSISTTTSGAAGTSTSDFEGGLDRNQVYSGPPLLEPAENTFQPAFDPQIGLDQQANVVRLDVLLEATNDNLDLFGGGLDRFSVTESLVADPSNLGTEGAKSTWSSSRIFTASATDLNASFSLDFQNLAIAEVAGSSSGLVDAEIEFMVSVSLGEYSGSQFVPTTTVFEWTPVAMNVEITDLSSLRIELADSGNLTSPSFALVRTTGNRAYQATIEGVERASSFLIPEPTSLALLAFGGAFLILRRTRAA